MKWKFNVGDCVVADVRWKYNSDTGKSYDFPWTLLVYRQGTKTDKGAKGKVTESPVYMCKDDDGRVFYIAEKELELWK